MATTAKRPATKSTGESPVEHLQEALRDIDKARQAAQGEMRAQLDEAYDRVRDTVTDLRERATGDVREWEDSLERASDHLRIELGLRAVRAQHTTDGLTSLSREIRKRKAELTATSV